MKGFFPEKFREGLKLGVLKITKELPRCVIGDHSKDQIVRIDVPVLNGLSQNLFLPVSGEDVDGSTGGVEFEGEKRLQFLGDFVKMAFPRHVHAEAFIFGHVEDLRGDYKDCGFHEDEPKPKKDSNVEVRNVSMIIPVDGRLPMDAWGVGGKQGRPRKMEAFGADSSTGDVSFMGMKTTHRTGKPDVLKKTTNRSKYGSKKIHLKVIPHWRLNVTLAVSHRQLVENRSGEEGRFEGVKDAT